MFFRYIFFALTFLSLSACSDPDGSKYREGLAEKIGPSCVAKKDEVRACLVFITYENKSGQSSSTLREVIMRGGRLLQISAFSTYDAFEYFEPEKIRKVLALGAQEDPEYFQQFLRERAKSVESVHMSE